MTDSFSGTELVDLKIPLGLRESCSKRAERKLWLDRLNENVRDVAERWSLKLGEPFEGEDVTCSLVAPAVLRDGSLAVLKLGMPHFEGEDEIAGLRFWNGDPMVKLLEADESLGAMLLERCVPGTSLRELPESDQDPIVASLLRRLWGREVPANTFRPLSSLLRFWGEETLARESLWQDAALVEDGLQLFDELLHKSLQEAALATDLHAGNILRAERAKWLVIDPKPFIGDPAYDATQHLLNCRDRLMQCGIETTQRFADLLEVDRERVRLWTFARLAVESGWEGASGELALLAKRLAP